MSVVPTDICVITMTISLAWDTGAVEVCEEILEVS